MRLTDAHCHLSMIESDLDGVLAQAAEAGVERVIDIGMGIDGSRAAAARAVERAGVFACVGIHPNDPAEFERDPEATMAALRDLAAAPRVVGIGETGLDTYRDRASIEVQEASFRAHIALARDTDRALVIHVRGKAEPGGDDIHAHVLDVLADAGAPDRVVMHCFSGDIAHAQACAERGFFCSFAGNLTYKRNAELRGAAASLPSELLLIETDAPFLTPEPYRGKPNHPALVIHTADVLAQARSTSLETLSETISANTERAFKLPAT